MTQLQSLAKEGTGSIPNIPHFLTENTLQVRISSVKLKTLDAFHEQLIAIAAENFNTSRNFDIEVLVWNGLDDDPEGIPLTLQLHMGAYARALMNKEGDVLTFGFQRLVFLEPTSKRIIVCFGYLEIDIRTGLAELIHPKRLATSTLDH